MEGSWLSNIVEDSGTSPFPSFSLTGSAFCSLVCHLMVLNCRLYVFTIYSQGHKNRKCCRARKLEHSRKTNTSQTTHEISPYASFSYTELREMSIMDIWHSQPLSWEAGSISKEERKRGMIYISSTMRYLPQ